MIVDSTFPVGKFTCRFTLEKGKVKVEWSPRMPKKGELGEDDLKQYRIGRDNALAGIKCIVIEY